VGGGPGGSSWQEAAGALGDAGVAVLPEERAIQEPEARRSGA